MYNKENLAVVKCASNDKGRYHINSVYFHKNFTVATDGTCLMIVTIDKKMKVDDMPLTEGVTPIEDFKPFILDKDQVLKLVKMIPKKVSIPILAYISPSQVSENNVQIYSNDLSSAKVETFRPVDAEYPKIGKVFPKGKPKTVVSFDADIMIKVLSAMGDAIGGRVSQVTMEVREEDRPVVIRGKNNDTGQKVTALVMPMRK